MTKYKIDQVDYHYYSHLTDGINELVKDGKHKFVQIVELLPSNDTKKMHRAIVLLEKRDEPVAEEQEAQYSVSCYMCYGKGYENIGKTNESKCLTCNGTGIIPL